MKNYKKKLGIYLPTLALALSTMSCSDAFDFSYFEDGVEDIELDIPVSGLPIGYISYSASELFEELNDELDVESGTDDIISFKITKDLVGSDNSDFLEVPPQTIEGDFDILEGVTIPGGIYSYGSDPIADAAIGTSKTQNFNEIRDLETEAELTDLSFSDGDLIVEFESTNNSQTEITFTMPSLINKNTGLPYEEDFILNNNGTGGDITSRTVSLANYDFDLTTLNPVDNSETSNIAVSVVATMTFKSGDALKTSDELTYTITIENPELEEAKGDFKNRDFSLADETFGIDFFDEIDSGNISFNDPTLKISATNGYGFPIGIALDGITTNAASNNILEIKPAGIVDSDNIVENNDTAIADDYYAKINAGTETAEELTIITINNENSNIADLLNENPSEFILNVAGQSNPNSTSENDNSFNIDNNISVSVDIELPLHVTFDDVEFNMDPLEFDLTEDEANDIKDNANEVSLLVTSKNTMPFNGRILMDFVDADGNSLFSRDVDAVEAALIGTDSFSTYSIDTDGDLKDASGNTVEGTKTTITLIESEIEVLGDVNEVNVSVIFDTDTTGDDTADEVKVKITDQVRIELAVNADLSIKL